jgi:hypothetical protein
LSAISWRKLRTVLETLGVKSNQWIVVRLTNEPNPTTQVTQKRQSNFFQLHASKETNKVAKNYSIGEDESKKYWAELIREIDNKIPRLVLLEFFKESGKLLCRFILF